MPEENAVIEAKSDEQAEQSEHHRQAPVFNVIRHSSLRSGGGPASAVVLVEMNLPMCDAIEAFINEVETSDDPHDVVLQSFASRLKSHATFIRREHARRMADRATSEAACVE